MEYISKTQQEIKHNNNNNTSPTSSPKPTTPRSDQNNPYPTTFVQADTSNFKQVVQMLTGGTCSTPPSSSNSFSETFKQTSSRQSHIPLKKQGFKALYERRNNNNNKNNKSNLMINTFLSPRHNNNNVNMNKGGPEILSPSVLDFPSLTLLSPVTPLRSKDVAEEAYDKSSVSSSEEEERAIAEKGFYLHPSPRDAEPPQLLPLFPLTSPRVTGSTTASS